MTRPVAKKRASGARDGQRSDELRRTVEQAFGAMMLVRPVTGSDGRLRDARIVAVNEDAAHLLRAGSAAALKDGSMSDVATPAALAQLLDQLQRDAVPSGEARQFDWSPCAGATGLQVRAIATDQDEFLLSLRERATPLSSHTSLQQILDHAPFAIVVKTPDGRYLFVNREFERQVGVSAANVVGKTSFEVLPHELARRFSERDRMVRETRAQAILESEETLQGTTRTYLNRAFPVLDERGEVTAIIGTETDITEWREAQRRLRESETRFRAIFESAAVGIALYGLDGRVITCNPTYATILGYTPDELTGMSFVDLTYPDDRERSLELTRKQIAGETDSFDVEKRYMRKDGRPIWGRVTVSLIRNEHGEPLYTIAILADQSAYRAAEERLRQSERQLRLITDSVPVLIAYCDTKGHYRFVNREYEKWTGRARDEMIGASIRATLGEANYQRIAPHVEAVLTGQPQQFETEIDYPRSGRKAVSCVYVPHVLDDGTVQGFFAVATDVSLRAEQERVLRLAKEQAEEASRAKSAFLATMSHELRTPLNAIIGFSEMIRDEVMGPVGSPRYRDYASDIHLSGEHLLDLINSILDLARIEAGTFEIDARPVDLAEVVRLALQIMLGPAAAAGLTVETAISETPVIIEGDAARLRQIAVNLLSNAIKFTPSGGAVRLRVTLTGEQTALFEVEDTGIGITADNIVRALEPFAQVDNRFSRRYQGAGIGLPLSKALVEAQHGSFAIRSMPGEGTTVSVRFPLLKCGKNEASS